MEIFKSNFKKCIKCRKVFQRPPGINDYNWTKKKYCPSCSPNPRVRALPDDFKYKVSQTRRTFVDTGSKVIMYLQVNRRKNNLFVTTGTIAKNLSLDRMYVNMVCCYLFMMEKIEMYAARSTFYVRTPEESDGQSKED